MRLQQRSPILLSLVLCLGLSGTAFLAHAQEGSTAGADGKGHHAGHHGMKPASSIDLDLDKDQLEGITDIQKKLRADLTELTEERSEQEQRLKTLYAADQLYASDITNQQQRVFDIIKEITELQVEAQLDMRNLLSTTQINKLKESGDWLILN